MHSHVEAFLEALRNRAVSEHTLSSYESDLRDLESFLSLRKTDFDSIDHIFIRDFLGYLYERDLKKTSVESGRPGLVTEIVQDASFLSS